MECLYVVWWYAFYIAGLVIIENSKFNLRAKHQLSHYFWRQKFWLECLSSSICYLYGNIQSLLPVWEYTKFAVESFIFTGASFCGLPKFYNLAISFIWFIIIESKIYTSIINPPPNIMIPQYVCVCVCINIIHKVCAKRTSPMTKHL